MRYLFLFLSGLWLLSACNTNKNSDGNAAGGVATGTAAGAITGTKWKLTELNGSPVADSINGRAPFLELHPDSVYAASGGCNSMGGAFELPGDGRILFSRARATMMACENMEVEARLGEALAEADNYTIHGDTLSLNKADRLILARFMAWRGKAPAEN